MLLSGTPIDLKVWRNKLNKGEKSNLALFIEHIEKQNGKKIFVDCSASAEISLKYSELLKKDIHIVTANKIANTESWKQFRRLKELSGKNKPVFLYETNVGAGLPVVKTIQDLIKTGDKIKSVDAVLSGTLSYLFNNFDGRIPFSQLIKKAYKLGYTEPDPRVDLGGKDMARKLLILARECDKKLEMEDVKIEPLLLQKTLDAKNNEQFFELLKAEDNHFEELRKEAERNGHVLRFIGNFDGKKITLGLKTVGPENPFYGLTGSENSVAIYSDRYRDLPIVIKGPGAGAAVTAAGVLNDIISVTERYG